MAELWGFLLAGIVIANAVVNPGILSIIILVMLALSVAVEIGKNL